MEKFFLGFLGVAFGLSLGLSVMAQDTASVTQVYARGKVMEVVEDKAVADSPMAESEQVVLVEVLKGEDKGEAVTITYIFSSANYDDLKLEEGDRVVIAKVNDARGDNYYILDSYRLSTIFIYVAIFAFAAIVFGRSRGAGSLVGLGASLAILMLFVVPQIIQGGNPLMISFLGSCAIAIVSLLLAHGFNRRAFVALAATLMALVAAFILAIVAGAFAHLSGTGTEQAIYLQLSYLPNLDLRGLLLGSIVIGALGVLDDVTTAQVAAVEEIGLANENLGVGELYKRGISVGREHIAALVNTLILAYAGASFPLFMLFALPDHPPLWVVLNSESIIEEILRALVGGTALMLAVPISTALAAAVFGSLPKPERAPGKRIAHHH
ncbi:MAG TPA: YibE/F family protein [bacterium]|nr:YibE/F family protein [bacterium]